MPTRDLPARDSETGRLPAFDNPTEFLQFLEDHEFDLAYPEIVRRSSNRHWTPMEVGRKAARFLVDQPGKRVLDVGCGPGKFCAIGAVTTEGHFTGVEQRERLVSSARRMLHSYRIPRVEILHANVTEVPFDKFQAFYIFNPFQENLHPALGIDTEVPLNAELFDLYTNYVHDQLSLAPVGTRVATYWGDNEMLPDSYHCLEGHFDDRLMFWIKRPLPNLAARASTAALPTVHRSPSLMVQTLVIT